MIHLENYIYLIPLLLSAIAGLKAWRGSWSQPFRWFSVFLLATLAIELFALLWKASLHSTSWWHYKNYNLWIYNLYLLPQYLFYLYFFHEVLTSKQLKKAIQVTAVVYSLIAIVNILWVQKLHVINTYTIIAACTITSTLCILFFNQTSNSTEVLKPDASPEIWIASGMFIFHFCSLPVFIFSNYMNKNHLTLSLNLFVYGVQFFNIIMYSSYLIAFLCKPHFRK